MTQLKCVKKRWCKIYIAKHDHNEEQINEDMEKSLKYNNILSFISFIYIFIYIYFFFHYVFAIDDNLINMAEMQKYI